MFWGVLLSGRFNFYLITLKPASTFRLDFCEHSWNCPPPNNFFYSSRKKKVRSHQRKAIGRVVFISKLLCPPIFRFCFFLKMLNWINILYLNFQIIMLMLGTDCLGRKIVREKPSHPVYKIYGADYCLKHFKLVFTKLWPKNTVFEVSGKKEIQNFAKFRYATRFSKCSAARRKERPPAPALSGGGR